MISITTNQITFNIMKLSFVRNQNVPNCNHDSSSHDTITLNDVLYICQNNLLLRLAVSSCLDIIAHVLEKQFVQVEWYFEKSFLYVLSRNVHNTDLQFFF